MYTAAISPFHQLFYAIVPTISIIGNGFIVYVTIRSNGLRKPCNILIGLVSAGDIIHMLGHYVMLALFNLVENHLIRHDYCAYLQCAPIFGVVFSPMLLFALAVDRVLSLTKYYRNIIVDRYCIYLTLQILPASALGLTLSVWVILDSTPDRMIMCTVPSPLRTRGYHLFNKSVVVISVLVVITYIVFGFLLKKTSLRPAETKAIYRSVTVMSLAFVLGIFSTMLAGNIAGLLNVDRYQSALAGGIFVTLGCATNFFVYYFMSSKYRKIFDEFLGLERFKGTMGWYRKFRHGATSAELFHRARKDLT
ncbi:hypothetical protein Q1695_002572 [Nippostrongylus brasiliensis]|nr:hypothetical protein Q1695_002572 [Nippostrongylus brasiliensis]